MNQLPDELRASPALSRRLFLEADEGAAWAMIELENGNLHVAHNREDGPGLFKESYAASLLPLLNRNCSYGGSWAVGWCGPDYGKLIMIWSDHDGDQQFTVEDDERIELILECDPLHFVGQCHEAYEMWKKNVQIIDPNPEQTYKRAQGERRPSER